MYITIYFGEKPVLLCRSKDEIPEKLIKKEVLIEQEPSLYEIKDFFSKLENERIHTGILISEDLNELYKQLCLYFTEITAAGGVVINPKEEALLIFRRGKWDLPKGKLDDGETIEDCAIREVKEETGLLNVKITGELPITHHIYQQERKMMLKKSIWFKMFADDNQILVPQTEEDITEIKWVPVKELQGYLNQTYPSVKDVLTDFISGSF